MRKIKTAIIISFLTATMVLFENCSMVGRPGDFGAKTSASKELERLAMKVVNAKCAGCHNTQMPSGGVDYLTNVDSLLYYRMVIPGEPQLSYLYTVISKGSMPPAPNTLSSSEIKAIYDWIQDGFVDPSKIGVIAPPPTSNVLEPKFSSINKLVLQMSCLGCHNSTTPSGGVSYSTYASTLNTVQPGNVNASALYISISTGKMPKGGTPLSSSQLSVIQTWIQNGAPNN